MPPPTMQKLKKEQIESLKTEMVVSFWLQILLFVAVFMAYTVILVIMNIVLFSGLGLATYGSMLMGDEHAKFVFAIETNDKHTINHYLSFIIPIESAIIMSLTLMQFCIALWDYSLGVIQLLILIVIELVVVIFKFIIGTSLREIMFPLLDFAIQILRVLANVASEGLNGLNGVSFGVPVGSGTSAEFGANVGSSVDGSLLQFFVKLVTVIIVRMPKLFAAMGKAIYTFVDLLFSISKYLGPMVSGLMSVIKMMDPLGGFGKFNLGLLDMHYAQAEVSYGFCEMNYQFVKWGCEVEDTVASIMKDIHDALQPLCSCHISVPHGCNKNKLKASKCKKPGKNPLKNAGTAGAGICNTDSCVGATLEIIDLVAIALPTCSSWNPNATSVTECMAIVANYSIAAAAANSAESQIDTIAKELCFVLSTRIIYQCQNALPPYAFSVTDTAEDICVADKSGLSPPLAPFNERCACQYAQPLCPASCCDQYARHVVGQVKAMVGTLQCNQILLEYPQEFWCQFQSSSSDTILPLSDYTFSSVWCSAYQKYVLPICTLEPFWVFGSLPDSSLLPYLTDYLNSTCSTISNQTGVCIPYNATVSSDVYEIRHNQTLSSVTDLFSANNAANGFTSGFITNVPTESTPPEEVATLFLNKFLCQHLSKTYNNTVYRYTSRNARGVNASISRFCDAQLRSAFNSYLLQDFTSGLTYSVEGVPLTTALAGIPDGTILFGANTPVTTDPTMACPSSTGSSMSETSKTQGCSAALQQNSLSTLDSTTSSGTAALDQMQTTKDISETSIHLSPLATISPDDPLYEVKQQEANTLADSRAINSNVYYGKSAEDPPMTTTYKAWADDERPPAEDSIYNDQPVFLQINHKTGQRKPLSVEQDSDPDTDEWKQKVRTVRTQLDGIMDSTGKFIATIITNIHAETEAHNAAYATRLRNAVDQDMRDFVAGNARIGDQNGNFMRRTSRMMSINRRILSTTGDPETDAELNAMFLAMGNVNAEDKGISQASFEAYVESLKQQRIGMLLSALKDIWLPKVYATFWDIAEDGAATFGASTTTTSQGTPNCNPTTNDPYKCCKGAEVGPYECCHGLIGCLPLLTDIFFPTRTTHENVDRWLCRHYDTAPEYYLNGLRAVLTWGVLFVATVFGPYESTIKSLFSFVAFPGYTVPDNTLGCMVWLWKYSIYFLDALAILFLFASAMVASWALVLIKDKYTRIKILQASLEEEVVADESASSDHMQNK